jgi:pimeloyl-ACP methyl ester carboxylesterase
MYTTTSADGTTIAYDREGSGPPIIMVVGAFNTRATTAPLAAALADTFTVLNYDRRGRGDSGDTPPYSVQREIEDIAALIAEPGGSAALFGYSSGATLALKAAADGLPITKLALYDPPFVVDDSRPLLPASFAEQLAELIAAGRRGDAVELYQHVAVGIPQEVVARMRQAPFRPGLEAIAHTLVYDATVIGDLTLPPALVASVAIPTLVIDGEHSPPIMHSAAEVLVQGLADGRRYTLAGQSHDISSDATAPVLRKFLSGSRA